MNARLCQIALVLILSLLSNQTSAKVLFTYSREERLATLNQDTADTTQNVSITEIPPSSVPPFIQAIQKQIITECFGDQALTNAIRTYEYVSDWHRRTKLGASYIADYSPLQGIDQKPCFSPTICETGECQLIGFTPIAENMWTESFSLSVAGWTLKNVETREGNGSMGIISTMGRAENCAARGGKETNEQCELNYLWRTNGLAPAQ